MVEKYLMINHGESMSISNLQDLFSIILKRFDHSEDAQECIVNFFFMLGDKYHRNNEYTKFFIILFKFEVDNLLIGKW